MSALRLATEAEITGAVRPYVPILRRLRAAGWVHYVYEMGRTWDHVWMQADETARVILDDVGNLLVHPAEAAPWQVPVQSPDQVGIVLELAGVLPPVPQPPAVRPAAVAELRVRAAISDPGMWLPRHRYPDGVHEPMTSWSARAVVAMLTGQQPRPGLPEPALTATPTFHLGPLSAAELGEAGETDAPDEAVPEEYPC